MPAERVMDKAVLIMGFYTFMKMSQLQLETSVRVSTLYVSLWYMLHFIELCRQVYLNKDKNMHRINTAHG